MHHEILGEINRNAADGDGVAMIEYDLRKIKIQIIPDVQPFETTLKIAADVITRLEELDNVAKRIIVADLRDCYNSAWSEYDEVQEDGSLKTVSNPQLSESEFEKKLSLIGVDVIGNSGVDFFYDDSGLFAGHSVVVISLNGTDFSDARAEFFG
ncbi:MAG: DUF2262 domain-containing protein [Gemmataceae bacterium]|nr:DUF2262 domain-containing protein [Gemmataceae bacterium]MCI0741384.1 DUF2262 domain-containing protein [Gemmataceae bacterium]